MRNSTTAVLVSGCLSLWMLTPSLAHAQSIDINLDAAKAKEYNLDVNGLEDNLSSAVSDQLNIGDQIMSVNGTSLVGLPLSSVHQGLYILF